MHLRQFYVGCLAHASYLIGDGGEAVVVDPSRDIEMYLDEAAVQGLRITWVLETHLHADFVSGHRELAARTGATIGIGARAEAGFPHRALRDGDQIMIGGTRIVALETPGHTPESLSFAVFERAADPQPVGVLTGDTLFVGDVGRVDILSSRLPVAELAGLMYDSLHRKLLTLPDHTRVYPAHGAGSLCGRSMSAERSSTIGQERATNPALAPMSREAFIADITRDVPETPVYFLHSRDTNRAGPALRAERPLPPALSPTSVAAEIERGAIVLDARPFADYAAGRRLQRAAAEAVIGAIRAGRRVLDVRRAPEWNDSHLEGAHHIPLAQLAARAGELDRGAEWVVVCASGYRSGIALSVLERAGFTRLVNAAGGMDAWRRAGLAVVGG